MWLTNSLRSRTESGRPSERFPMQKPSSSRYGQQTDFESVLPSSRYSHDSQLRLLHRHHPPPKTSWDIAMHIEQIPQTKWGHNIYNNCLAAQFLDWKLFLEKDTKEMLRRCEAAMLWFGLSKSLPMHKCGVQKSKGPTCTHPCCSGLQSLLASPTCRNGLSWFILVHWRYEQILAESIWFYMHSTSGRVYSLPSGNCLPLATTCLQRACLHVRTPTFPYPALLDI